MPAFDGIIPSMETVHRRSKKRWDKHVENLKREIRRSEEFRYAHRLLSVWCQGVPIRHFGAPGRLAPGFRSPRNYLKGLDLAERGGFEPPVEVFPLRRFSKPLLSTTQPPLRGRGWVPNHYTTSQSTPAFLSA